MVRYVKVWNLAAGRKQGKKKKNLQLSGADSAWLLVNSSWSQQEGKSLSDKVASFLSAPKEGAL